MKVALTLGLLLASATFLTPTAHAQTSILNLDDDPISSPNDPNNDGTHKWAYSTGGGVGCGSLCNPTGSLVHTSYYNVDGQSLQFNLAKNSGCTGGGCYGDLDFANHIYRDGTANNATSFTLDMQATGDSITNSSAQAIEFTIEQDLPNGSGADRYIYSWQCLFNDPSPHWRLWNGAYLNSNGSYGRWEDAITTGGSKVPCTPFTAGSFNHYYFHFKRLAATKQIQFTDFTIVINGTSYYYPFNEVRGIQPTVSGWGQGLFTAIQLDGNSTQSPYSVWADKWTVAYQ